MFENVSFTAADGRDVTVLGRDLAKLSSAVHGELIWRGSADYESARKLWNGLVDKEPALIVRCADEDDAVAAVRFAQDHALPLSVRGGGHNVAGRALVDGGVVVDFGGMKEVLVDLRAQTAMVEAGARLGDVDLATHGLGLAVPLGVVSETGVAGLTLHGGYGWLSRKHGLSLDNLLAARVVLADGRIVDASPQEHPELFWALRGGGGNFGAVTSFTFRLHPIPRAQWFGLVLYPVDQAPEVLPAFREAISTSPNELGALALFWEAPALPGLARAHQGAPVVILAVTYNGERADGERALRPFREAGRPLADTCALVPFSEVQKTFDADYPAGDLYYWKSAYLRGLPDALAGALTQQLLARPSPRSSIDLWPLGGAVSQVPVDATAFASRDAPFLLALEANWSEFERTRENIEWARQTFRALTENTRADSYLNFPGFAEEGEALVREAYGRNLPRLRAIKRRYDPDNVFQGNFNIRPAKE